MSTGAVQSMFNTMDLLRRQRNAGFEDDKARWDHEQDRKKAGWDGEDRAVTVRDRARQEAYRTGLINVVKDADIEEVDVPSSAPATEGATPSMTKAFKLGGKQYATKSEAEAAREVYNSRGAKMQRAADFTLESGNPVSAPTLSEAGFKWDQSMRDDVKRRFEDDYAKNVKLGDWQGLANFVNNSPISPAKATFALTPDGKQQAFGEDGKPIPGMTFPNTPEGHAEAAKLLFGRLTPEQHLTHIYARQKVAADAAQQTVDNGRKERQLAAYEKSVNNQGLAAQARAARGSGSGDGEGDGGTDSVNMTEIDKVVDDYLATKDENGKVSAPADPELRRAVRALAGNFRESLTDPAGAAMRAVKMYREALASSGNDVKQAMQRVAIALDVERNGGGGHQIQLGGPGAKVESYGVDAKASPGKLPAKPATGAMAQLMAQDAAKAKAKADAEAQVRAAREAEAAAAAQMTLEQIRALNPDEAFRLLNSPAGRQLDPRVRAILEAQAIGNTVAPNRIGSKL